MMARPKPKAENAKQRTTVSLSAAVKRAADRYGEIEHPYESENFSKVVQDALTKYISVKHPHLIDQMKKDLRIEQAISDLPDEKSERMVAEDTISPSIDQAQESKGKRKT